IQASRILLRDGARISAQSTGTGNAGTIKIVDSDRLDMRGASVTARAKQAGGGDIEMFIPGRIHLKDSAITARAEGPERSHDGGNVSIHNNDFFIMDNSLVLASAKGGDGGDIRIASAQFVPSAESILDASSELGVDGTVLVNSPDVNMEAALTPPANLLNAQVLLDNLCRVRDPEQFNRFTARRYASTSAVPEDWQGSVFLSAFFDANSENFPLHKKGEAKGCLNGNPKFCFGNERSEFPKRRGSDISGIPSSFPKQAERGFRSGTKGAKKNFSKICEKALDLSDKGRYAAAQDLMLEILDAVEDPARRSLLHSHIGDLRLATQQFGLAREHLEKGLKSAREFNRPAVLAHVLNNLGNLHGVVEEDYEHALEIYKEALELVRPGEFLYTQILFNRARAYLKWSKKQTAASLLPKIDAEIRKLPPDRQKNRLLLSLGQLALAAGNSPLDVHALLAEAHLLAVQRQNKRLMAYAKGYLGELYARQQRTEALQLAREAIFLSQEFPEILYRWEWLLGRILQVRGDLDGALKAYRQAQAHLHPIRTRLSIGQRDARGLFHEHIRPVYFSLADVLLQQAAEAPPEDKAALLKQAVATLEKLKAAELEDYFQDACLSNARAEMKKIERPDLHTAFLYPVMLPDRTELLLSFADGFHQAVTRTGMEELTQTVLAFRRNLQVRISWRFIGQARQLYRQLIAPIKKELDDRNIDTLVIIPDGSLRTIPFAALHDGKRYLAEKFALAVTPGLELTDLRPLSVRNASILLNGLSEGVQEFTPLPNVPEEIERINAMFDRSAVLLNKTFLLDEMDAALQKTPYEIIHVASHGHFSRDPNKTFLLAYDDKLTINRLEQILRFARTRHKPVELLTLSACQTAAGDERAALGLAGVAIKAGAGSALASLWFVSDKATLELMVEFYRLLQEENMTKAQALQNVQIQFIKDHRFRHPAYWAPFLLIGNWI
ncbi:MAG: CHAT domain-containing protein, partial [Gammaproteobacteria bacterium]|nr:CHAT domain-containing protein [Gammaproteobacteria bacterium]